MRFENASKRNQICPTRFRDKRETELLPLSFFATKGKEEKQKPAQYLVDGERQLFFVRERCLRRKKKEEEKKREKKSGKKMEEQKEQKEKEKEKEKEEKEEHFHTKSVKVVVTHTQKNMYGRRRRRRRKQKEFKRKPFLLRAKRR